LQALAADLVRLRVAVLVATGTPANVIAMKATTEIPIVFTTAAIQSSLISLPAWTDPAATSPVRSR